MANKHILYVHRTQGRGVEGFHIRGMIDGFKKNGYFVAIIGPPGINMTNNDPFHSDAINKSVKSIEKAGTLKSKLWQIISLSAPQINFEVMELVYKIYAFNKINKYFKTHKVDFIYERYALNTVAAAFSVGKTPDSFCS